MSTPAPSSSSPSSWQSLVSQTSREVMSKIQQEKPELLTSTFQEPMKFLPITPSCRQLIDAWLQREDNRQQVASACHQDPEDITRACIETGAVFICLKTEKPCQIPKPVPEKTLILIALGPLQPSTGIFRGVNLAAGASVVVSGDKIQIFNGGNRGGGLGFVLRVKFKS